MMRMQGLSSGILALAFKGQVLAAVHAQIMLPSTTTLDVSKRWLDLSDTFNKHVSSVIRACAKNMNHYVQQDIDNPLYQNLELTEATVVNTLKSTLDKRYSWTEWLVLVTSDEDAKMYVHRDLGFVSTTDGERKIVALPMADAYPGCDLKFPAPVKHIVTNWEGQCENAGRYSFFFPIRVCTRDRTYDVIQEQLVDKRLSVGQAVTVVTDVNEGGATHLIDEDREDRLFDHSLQGAYWNDQVKIIMVMDGQCESNAKNKYKVPCHGRDCSGRGECLALPYSNEAYCVCEKGFEGDNCEAVTK